MTTTFKSTQIAAFEALVTGKFLAKDVRGKVDFARFNVVNTGAAVNDTVELVRLPSDAVVIGFQYTHSAFGGTATLDIGVEDGAADSIVDGDVVSAAGANSDLIGEVDAGGKSVYATYLTTDPDDASTLDGYILYTKGA